MMTVDEALQCADASREVDAPAGSYVMMFMPVYKCRRCGMVFSKGTTYDSKYHSPFRTELHEHICAEGQHGVAEAVGFDEVPEEPAPWLRAEKKQRSGCGASLRNTSPRATSTKPRC